ncbi:hypothetical protein AKJ16_DCAP25533 [Drosera capensis]
MSLSSSSPSSAIFTDKFFTHKAPGCFSGVIRRILCSSGLPTYPFDKIKESELGSQDEIHPCFTTFEKIVDSGSPNLVARLMGLNSLSETGFGETRKARDSLSRSKSMNSTDLRSEEVRMDDRRLKKSRSSREMPVSFEIEDDEFFVLTFGTELDSKDGKQRRRRGEKNRAKQRKQRSCAEDDDNERVSVGVESSSSGSSSMEITSKRDCREVRWSRRRKKKTRGKCDGERESVSENSSPVSVLDLTEFTIDHDVSTPEEDSRSRVSSNTFSIRNLTAEISDDEFPSDYSNSISKQANEVQPSADEGKNHFLRNFSSISRDHHSVDMLSKIYRLAGNEVLQSSSAHNQRKETVNRGVDWENVGAEVGSHVFDQLIDDLVAELVGTS